ncbi:acetyl-CoA synthetase [Nitrosomonas sp. Nm51]|nr:acetyl-CoA synthetase [Nitrosomonas sp. Nm51]
MQGIGEKQTVFFMNTECTESGSTVRHLAGDSGHRLGTMEIEPSLVASPLVAEATVVGKPHEVKGKAIIAFVVLKGDYPQEKDKARIVEELREWVAQEIGPIAKPEEIRFGENLPKTRSGKIMRRLLRTSAKDEKITQYVSTLENPAILDQPG